MTTTRTASTNQSLSPMAHLPKSAASSRLRSTTRPLHQSPPSLLFRLRRLLRLLASHLASQSRRSILLPRKSADGLPSRPLANQLRPRLPHLSRTNTLTSPQVGPDLFSFLKPTPPRCAFVHPRRPVSPLSNSWRLSFPRRTWYVFSLLAPDLFLPHSLLLIALVYLHELHGW